jgi:predicted enzyme related to lactoylglutathione lyase
MKLPTLSVVALDCPDPIALADFYSRVTGLAVEPLGDFPPDQVTWIELVSEARPTIGFQKIDNYVAPVWPTGNVPQQLHLDFEVDDLDAGQAQVLAAGATKTEVQPGRTFRVFLDPVGHPFCLVLRGSED